jgi:hypothetical protein
MHLTHIKLKPTRVIKTNFNTSEIGKDIEIPTESIELAENYQKSKKEIEDYDIMIAFEDHIIFGFDFVEGKEKYIIPEINPTTIFYSNAVMSHRKLIFSREELFKNSPTTRNFTKTPIQPNHFGYFFQLASNCIINLQSTVESFANRKIPKNYKCIGEDGKEFDPSIFHKLNKLLPKLKNEKFQNKGDNIRIKNLIELRNEIIHLKPIQDITNTEYKDTYRKLLKFDFTKAIISVKNFVNFYEPNLIEECSCEKELYYDINERFQE